MESNNELIANLKKEVKEELKGEFNETAVGYIHIFNKRLEEKLREQGIEYDKEKLEHKQREQENEKLYRKN